MERRLDAEYPEAAQEVSIVVEVVDQEIATAAAAQQSKSDPSGAPGAIADAEAPSVDDADGPILVSEQFAPELYKAVWASAAVTFSWSAGIFIYGVNIAFALNAVVNGDPEFVSPRSTMLLNVSIVVILVATVCLQEFWGQAVLWWGRRSCLLAMTLAHLLGALLALLGCIMEAVPLLIASGLFIGLGGGAHPQLVAYAVDLSTQQTSARNVGLVQGRFFMGSVLGMVITATSMELTQIFAVTFLMYLTALLIIFFVLPDWSPLAEKRAPCTQAKLLRALIPCSLVGTLNRQTLFTKFLLLALFFASAGFGCIRVWLFSFGIVHFGLTSQLCGLFVLVVGAVNGIAAGVATRFFDAKRGSDYLFWAQPLFAIYAFLAPGTRLAAFLGVALVAFPAVGDTTMSAYYFGQAGTERRGELAALSSVSNNLGKLLGTLATGPLAYAWVEASEETGSSHGLPPPPSLQALFEFLAVLAYFGARKFLSQQDAYGRHALKLSSSNIGTNTGTGSKKDNDDQASNGSTEEVEGGNEVCST
mmetsp:Transcript_10030/g.25047  ORF Transcript_10030/g.25047 Transcript_10030/m.25047 type:complete len:532 (+) Transcript_10030:53-1648(+)